MLESLSLRNFQRWKRLDIEFSPTVTTLTGPTDAGKSSIIRVLRWIALNRPQGDAFIRHGADYVSGKLLVDGHEVRRERAGGDNSYWLDGNKFQSFGFGVPDEVSSLLNIADINLQRQHDPPWWFMLSPGEISRELNTIVNLGLIDSTLAYIATEVKKSKSEADVTENRLKDATAKLDQLKWTTEADQLLTQIEELERKLELDRVEQSRIVSLQEGLANAEETVFRAVAAKVGALKATAGAERLLGLGKEIAQLEVTLGSIEESELLRKRVVPEKVLAKLEQSFKKVESLSKECSKIQDFLTKYQRSKEEACQARKESKRLLQELERDSGGLCPICQRPMKS